MIYSEFRTTDFHSYFNLSELSSSTSTRKRFKPGGFQEHVDLELRLDEQSEIMCGELILDRKFIGNTEHLNAFAKDIAKSFIAAFIPQSTKLREDDPALLLVHSLMNLIGSKDPIIPCSRPLYYVEGSAPRIQPLLDTYRGTRESAELQLSNSNVSFKRIEQGKKARLSITWSTK